MGVFPLSPLDFGVGPGHNERLLRSFITNSIRLYYMRICSISSYSYPVNLWPRLFILFLGRGWLLLHWELASFNLFDYFSSLIHWQRRIFPEGEQGEGVSPECLQLRIREMKRFIPLQNWLRHSNFFKPKPGPFCRRLQNWQEWLWCSVTYCLLSWGYRASQLALLWKEQRRNCWGRGIHP